MGGLFAIYSREAVKFAGALKWPANGACSPCYLALPCVYLDCIYEQSNMSESLSQVNGLRP